MTVPPATYLELLHAITSPQPKIREQAADESTDLIGSYSSRQAKVLAFALASQSSIETAAESLEAELHAIIEIGTTGVIQNEDVNPLAALRTKDLPREIQEYVNDILEIE